MTAETVEFTKLTQLHAEPFGMADTIQKNYDKIAISDNILSARQLSATAFMKCLNRQKIPAQIKFQAALAQFNVQVALIHSKES